jgi:lipoprotein-anchoring transpeptidase ErfK/SrfK
MNTLKTVVVTVILMAVGYGVYVSLWQKPDPNAASTSSVPTASIPGQGSTNGQSSSVSPPPSPGTLGPQSPLFGSNSRSGNSGGVSSSSSSGTSRGSVTLIPGPNAEKPPITPLSPAPGMTTSYDQSSAMPAGGMATPPGGPSPQDEFRENYLSFIKQIEKTLDEGKLAEALQALTSVYEQPNVPDPQKREVEHLLDQLAGTVIYSRQSYIYPPYTVQPSDTLDQIAERCGVPALLLARINGIEPQQLQPGQTIKILRGPFSAVVSLDKHELTLKLEGGYYAGRFAIGLGTDCPKVEGNYTVQDKTPRPIYHGPDGLTIAADDGRNPLGKYWIGLGERIGLHGTIDESGIGRNDSRGVICLKDRDIEDLFGILSVGSKVVIRR